MNKKEEKNNTKPISYKPISEDTPTSSSGIVDVNLAQEQEWYKYKNYVEKIFYYLKQKGYLINTFTDAKTMVAYITLMNAYDEPRKTLIENTKKCMGLSYDLGSKRKDILNNIIKSMKKDKSTIEEDTLLMIISVLGLLWSPVANDQHIVTTFPCSLEDFEKYYLPIIKMTELIKKEKYSGKFYNRLALGLLYYYTIDPSTFSGAEERRSQLEYIKIIYPHKIDNTLLSYYSFRK